MISKIISGGQTGADRAALDVAIKFGIPHGGWVPKGRKTEESGPVVCGEPEPRVHGIAEVRDRLVQEEVGDEEGSETGPPNGCHSPYVGLAHTRRVLMIDFWQLRAVNSISGTCYPDNGWGSWSEYLCEGNLKSEGG